MSDTEYARSLEDAVFEADKTILRLVDELDRLAAELHRRPAGKWDDANRKRSADASIRGMQARALHAQGRTVAQIMARLGKSRRTVEGYLGPSE